MTKLFNDCVGASESPEIQHLIGALVKAQSLYPTIDMDAKNDHFRSKYATYRGCCEALRVPLTSNGIALPSFQSAYMQGIGWILIGVLRHVSGQFISGSVPLLNPETQKTDRNTKEVVVTPPGMQGLGSAMTYAKRQLLLSLSGGWVGEADDDGESVTSRVSHPTAASAAAAAKPSTTDLAFEARAKSAICDAADITIARRALSVVELRVKEGVVGKGVLDRCVVEFKKKWGEA